jgi:hypothetical protein
MLETKIINEPETGFNHCISILVWVKVNTKEKAQIIAAITKLGGSVTAADVATETGLSPDIATQNLNLIASETGGRLQVSKSGDIAYSFQPGFAGTYLAHGLKLFVLTVLKQAFQIGYFVFRISFGLGLVLSFGVFLLFLMPSFLFELFSAEVAGLFGREGKKKTRKKKRQVPNDMPPEPTTVGAKLSWQASKIYSFFLKCFSFLFGDGNPNERLEEKRWQLIARAIRAKQYALTADELSPYTGGKPGDEDAVLPVLVRFNGSPEVTESGNIIYQFPSLKVEVAEEQHQELPRYLEETPWIFSKYSDIELQPVKQLAALNLLGSWLLWYWSFQGRGWHFPLFDVLFIYGTTFIALPFVRGALLDKKNAEIAQRNDERLAYAKRLEAPKKDLKKKLMEATKFKLETSRIDAQSIVYSTDKDLLDQPDALEEPFGAAAEVSKSPGDGPK